MKVYGNSNLPRLPASRVKRRYLKIKIGATVKFERP
jgi:hypothetical protein